MVDVTLSIDNKTKKSADAVFNKLGITAGEAVAMFFRKVAENKSIPFNYELNEETKKAVDDIENGRNVEKISFEDLWKL